MGTLGENIKKRRLELNMTQEELAIRAGYSTRSSINRIETSENDIPQKRLQKIADALETTPAHLLDYDDDIFETIKVKYYLIPEDKRPELLNYMEYLSRNSNA